MLDKSHLKGNSLNNLFTNLAEEKMHNGHLKKCTAPDPIFFNKMLETK